MCWGSELRSYASIGQPFTDSHFPSPQLVSFNEVVAIDYKMDFIAH